MSGLLNEIQRILADLRSDKAPIRNKAVEQLDQKLNSSREALNAILGRKQEISWQNVFEVAKEAAYKHAHNLQDAREKAYKTLADKCYLYGNVLDKIIDYNLEMGRSSQGYFLAKSTVFNAFEEGIKQRIVVQHFGDHFLNMLDRGIFLSPSYVNELKVSEYSRTLSYLFELNIENDEFLRTKLLKCITKTVQLAKQRVQLHADLADYLPELRNYTLNPGNAERKTEIVRLYHLFVSELSVNYHHKLCIHMQGILPKLCDFHNDDTFRDETKNIFFECVILSLYALYPRLKAHDFNTFQVPIEENWPQTMQKLKTIMHMEIRKNSMSRSKAAQLNSDKFSHNFIKMSALIMYIILWHVETNKSSGGEETPKKRSRIDQMETIINLIEKQETSFNDIWFAIFAELLQLSNAIINVANYQQVLQTTLDVLLMHGNGRNLRNIRLCLSSLLNREKELLETQSMPCNFMSGTWTQIATHLISETRPAADIILEKQIILQTLIQYDKLNATLCASLLQSITTNEMLRRNECIETIRCIFIHAENCGLDKASSDLEPIITWAFASEKNHATQMIYNIEPINTKLLADTFAIGIINFLDQEQLQQLGAITFQEATTAAHSANLQLLEYKYNKQLVCLEPKFQIQLLKNGSNHSSGETVLGAKNGLFQNNYELLMRMLNLSTTNENSTSALLKDLKNLHKLVCTMERLLHYKVFDADNFDQCPLIKRIGLFLSHIEFQYKANQPDTIDESDLRVILQQKIAVLDVFNSNEILMEYLEKQPIEMFIEFLGILLKHYSRRDSSESIDRTALVTQCLHILGSLCANSSDTAEAFRHIYKNLKGEPEHVLLVTKMLCRCKSLSNESITWLVDKLKSLFQQHYLNVDIISQVVDHMPTIFYFVYNMESLLDDMLMALMSLLKIVLKKSYPTQLSVKIVCCVAHIAQRCPNIYDSENFSVICMSVAKFLTMPTLEIRYATLSTLTLLLNTSYCVTGIGGYISQKSEQHLLFCEKLYESIDWKKLSFISEDLVQNNHSVTIQTLIAFFAFSSFHQEIALQDLLPYCAKHKLTETNFCALESTVSCHKQTMRQLMIPYTDGLLNKWHSQCWAVSKFPYYLCYNSRDVFIKAHARTIMAYTFLYGKSEDIKLYRNIICERECLPILRAFMAAELSDCAESNCVDFRQHHSNLQQNLAEYKLNPMDVELNATTLYNIIRLLLDKDEVAKLFNSTMVCNRTPAWYNLSKISLFKCLVKQLNSRSNVSQDTRIQAMSMLICNHSLILIELLTMLKTDCHNAILSSHMLRCFFLYCSIADAILDSIQVLETTSSADPNLLAVNCTYFARDIWFFICRFVLHTKCDQLHAAALEYIQVLLGRNSFEATPHAQSTPHLDELAKLLIACVLHIEAKPLKIQAAGELETFIDAYKQQLNLESLRDEAGNCEELELLSELFEKRVQKSDSLEVLDYIRAFLKPNRLENLHGLRAYIAEHKDKLMKYEQLLFELVSRLLRLVRESPIQTDCMDALKCLAEIGPLKMQHISYYFQTDFEPFEKLTEEPMEQFLDVIMGTLEKQLFHFNTSTQQALIIVAGHAVNSKSGNKLIVLYPNLRIFCTKLNKTSFLNSCGSIPSINWLAILTASEEHLEYEQWLCGFMCLIFQACGWSGFDAFAAKSFDFATACLQPFIKLLLANEELHLGSLCLMLDHFFNKFCSTRSAPNQPKCIYQEKRVIKRFLYICECIRLVNDWHIPISLCNVVLASNHCQAYFLSIMYLELWACSRNAVPDEDILSDGCFQMCAKTAYESIGCVDALPSFLDPMRSRVDYLSLKSNLSGILLESDNLDLPNSQLCVDIMKSNGMLSFANLQQRQNKDQQVDYEILWRLCQWDEPVDGHQKVNFSNNMELEFKKHHYMALKSISNREEENTVSAIKNAYHCIQGILRDISVECLQSVYKYMTWLCTLQQAEDFRQIQFTQQLAPEQIAETFNKWQKELNLTYGNFSCKEHILSHKITLFKMSGTRANRRIQQFYKQSPVDTYLLKCIGECKDAGKLNLATKYIAALRDLANIKEPTKISVLLEDAEVNVKTGNYAIAKVILQHVVTNNDFTFCLQRVPALRMQGEFLLDSNAQNFSYVLEHKFLGSLKLLDQIQLKKALFMDKHPDIFQWNTFDKFENKNRMAAHEAIAKYADREYQQLHDYCRSQEYQMLVDIIQQNRRLAGTVSDRARADRDRQVSAINLNRFASLDEKGLQRIEENLTEHLCTALEHYMAYSQLDSGSSSAAIYRIIALWFTNDQNKKMLPKIKEQIKNVPTYKFICAVNQLASRLNSKNLEFREILVDLLVRCGKDHSQQTFYKLYPLVYAHMDGQNSNSQRTEIATKIIADICAANPAALSVSKQFEAMFPALITFANSYVVTGPNNRPIPKGVPEKLKKLSALKLNEVQCPTLDLAVKSNQNYNITSIVRWKSDFMLCGGLNAPIKVLCLCSDGVVRPQLIKGKDDLRQDAVMQQVFDIVNELLNSDSEYIERKLQLRTYKVTPLSMRSGILEWCSNTIPVATYLVGNGCFGAHMKYHPNDWNNKKCREMSMAALRKPASVRKAIYAEICSHVKPVFHYFLLEKFPIPGVWFERRLAYTNSVAATSMVGYVLGLGDRHTQNILIDEQTAEVVHIDFGIAFEQGKIQTTPETVPFRLTRDFVAPMGVCGTNGVFTKSCEAMMHILRRYKSVFTTILEVLLYDPLFIWGILSTDQSQQSSNEESKNLLAQRALLLVQYKLEGREPGLLGTSSVEAQVQRLINEATLPSNLAMLYPGWDPYL